jgi:hypothetical protein
MLLSVTAGMVDVAALYLELPESMQHFMTAAAFGNQVSPPYIPPVCCSGPPACACPVHS